MNWKYERPKEEGFPAENTSKNILHQNYIKEMWLEFVERKWKGILKKNEGNLIVPRNSTFWFLKKVGHSLARRYPGVTNQNTFKP